jgi:aldose 1-epimerase
MEPSLVPLSAGELHVALAPDCGGSIAAFSRLWSDQGHEHETHWLRPATAEGLAARNPLAMGSFPLVPFCNRIRDGRARFAGREIRMAPNHPTEHQPHPLHGIGWLRPWAVEEVTARRAVLSLRVEASAAWPWAFSARQVFELDERQLQVTVELRNDDTAPMPAGIGHHPYFPHPPGTRLAAATAAMWEADAEVMPTALSVTPAVHRLREGVVLRDLDLDNNFTGWSHEARVDWPAQGTSAPNSLVLKAEPPLDFFVVYCPPQYDFFCAEPVSQCTDWVNLPQAGREQVGGAVLAPGQTLAARFSLVPQW